MAQTAPIGHGATCAVCGTAGIVPTTTPLPLDEDVTTLVRVEASRFVGTAPEHDGKTLCHDHAVEAGVPPAGYVPR